MRWLFLLFLLPACSTGYKPIVKNIQLGNKSADFFLSSARGKDTAHLYLNLNLQSASPADLQIVVTSADKDSLIYKLLKIKGPAKSTGMKVEHWVYYFYAAPARHFSRYVRLTISTQNIKKTFLLKFYRHVHLLS